MTIKPFMQNIFLLFYIYILFAYLCFLHYNFVLFIKFLFIIFSEKYIYKSIISTMNSTQSIIKKERFLHIAFYLVLIMHYLNQFEKYQNQKELLFQNN